ncbi:MAG: MopE-related protein [Phycisphaerae bacterium]
MRSQSTKTESSHVMQRLKSSENRLRLIAVFSLLLTTPGLPLTVDRTASTKQRSDHTYAISRTSAGGHCDDRDGDGYGTGQATDCPAGRREDCNDRDPRIFPGATERCNGLDDDCDGAVDEDFDVDGDGEVACCGQLERQRRAVLADCLNGPDSLPNPFGPVSLMDCMDNYDDDHDGDVDLRDVAKSFREFDITCENVLDCPPGTHLLHRSGIYGIPDPDTFDPASASGHDFTCVPDFSCDDLACGPNGRCVVQNGQALCVCRNGYVGEGCERCDVGYERNSSNACVIGDDCRDSFCSGLGECVTDGFEIKCECDEGLSGDHCEKGWVGGPNDLRPPPRVIIHGTEQSIKVGECRALTIETIGDGNLARDFRWTLDGPGTLDPSVGTDVFYCAPTFMAGDKSELAKIEICLDSFPNSCATRYITVDTAGGIISTGQPHEIFKPIDDVIKQYMRLRCVGGAVMGISVFGKVVYLKGYGNINGAPTDDPEYLEACGDIYNASDVVPGLALPAPAPVQPWTPFRIGSNSKCVGGAVLRDAVKTNLIGDPNAADTLVENMILCDTPGAVPESIREVMCGEVPPPLPLTTVSGASPSCDADNPCFNNGTCAENGSNDFCVGCDEGFSGADCSVNGDTCADLSSAADSRLLDLTFGHLLGHTSGFPRSAPAGVSVVTANFDTLRNADSEEDWIAQEQQLISEGDFPSGDFGGEFPNFGAAKGNINPGYFVPRPTIPDIMKARFGACLLSDPGSNESYSNTNFAFIGHLAEHITGQTFSAKVGKPDLHNGSALEDFLQTYLNVPLPTQGTPEGIFVSQDVLRLRHPQEPIYRQWEGGTYYPLQTDLKRPHCLWNGDVCSFEDFISGAVRYTWDFLQTNTLSPYRGGGNDAAGSTGSLAAEAEVFLKFMSRYWVGGGGSDPRYGKTRCPDGDCIWTQGNSHNGARAGTWSFVFQWGGSGRTGQDCTTNEECGALTVCGDTEQAVQRPSACRGGSDDNGTPDDPSDDFFAGECTRWSEYFMPPIDACGDIVQDDFANLECHACQLPIGVDIFIALNQSRDKKCAEAEALGEGHPDYYTCSAAYGLLKDFIMHGVCQVQWPPNSFAVWPPVESDGSSGLQSPGFGTEGAPAATAVAAHDGIAGGGLDCCGDGIKNFGEICDTNDFGGLSCASFNYEMGSLICNECLQIDTALCSGGIGLPPGSYGECDCGVQGAINCSDCEEPWDCPPTDDGFCIGGPCLPVDDGNHNGKLDAFSSYHPDGNYRDPNGGLYYCPGSDVVCSAEGAWGVCKECGNEESETTTRVGCPCVLDSDCEQPGLNLACYGAQSGGGPGFCWDAVDGPPDWQCAEGNCGMAPWYGDDTMYCEHYSTSGEAHCEPFIACNNILSEVCAGVGQICACIDDNGDGECDENAAGCTTSDCCDFECYEDSHCGQAFGWPFGYSCINNSCQPW